MTVTQNTQCHQMSLFNPDQPQMASVFVCVLLAGVIGAFVGALRGDLRLKKRPIHLLSHLAADLLVFASNFLVAIAQALNSLRYFHELLSTTR